MPPVVDVLDDTFVRVTPTRLRRRTRGRWETWLPDLSLAVHEERGAEGVRWTARTAAGVRPVLTGSAEVWLEALTAGTVVHLFVRLDPAPGTMTGRRARRLPDRVRRTWKRGLHRSKDVLEGEWQR